MYDVACSDGLSVDPQTHRCPDNGARVNLDDCSITAGVGAAELKTLWQDPSFTPGQGGILLRARTGEPSLPMVHLGCPTHRSCTATRHANHDTGARLVVTHLVQRIGARQQFFRLS